jgi:hypothetical protein
MQVLLEPQVQKELLEPKELEEQRDGEDFVEHKEMLVQLDLQEILDLME